MKLGSKFATSVACAAILPLVSATPVATSALGETLKQLYARAAGETPSCVGGYDGTDGEGMCLCGPGRIQSQGNLCVTPSAEGQFAVFPLEGPVQVEAAFTVSDVFEAWSGILDLNGCAAIAASQRTIGSDGFYYQSNEHVGSCWLISFSGVYETPSSNESGFPYALDRSGGPGRVKRGIPETGSVGQFAGTIAYSAIADPSGSATVGCLGEFDTRNPSGTCDCGVGRIRVEGSISECRFVASTLPGRKAKRVLEFGGVQW